MIYYGMYREKYTGKRIINLNVKVSLSNVDSVCLNSESASRPFTCSIFYVS